MLNNLRTRAIFLSATTLGALVAAACGDVGDMNQNGSEVSDKLKKHPVYERACPSQTHCCCTDVSGTACSDTDRAPGGTCSGQYGTAIYAL